MSKHYAIGEEYQRHNGLRVGSVISVTNKYVIFRYPNGEEDVWTRHAADSSLTVYEAPPIFRSSVKWAPVYAQDAGQPRREYYINGVGSGYINIGDGNPSFSERFIDTKWSDSESDWPSQLVKGGGWCSMPNASVVGVAKIEFTWKEKA